MPAWFVASDPLFVEPVGHSPHEPPATLYLPCTHTVQSELASEPRADSVPAAQSTTPPAEVMVPTAPPPLQYLFAGQGSGVSLSGVPEM
jgi:hypothetical protein